MKQKMKRKRLFGKKGGGQIFMGLLVILTLIIFSYLFLALSGKEEKFEKDIGERQSAILAATQQAEKALLYTDVAAKYAYDQAILNLAENWYDSDLCQRTYRGVPVIYGDEDCMEYNTYTSDNLDKVLETSLSDYFNDELNEYLTFYDDVSLIQNNYNINFEEGYVLVKAKEDIIIPIFSVTSKEVGDVAFASNYGSTKMFDIWPVEYEENVLTSCFGSRDAVKSDTRVGSTEHAGIDIRAPVGTPVLAVDDGVVTDSDPYRWGRVTIDHGDGIYSEYLHMDTVSVNIGDNIKAGEQVGMSGKRAPSGSYQPHLHFSIIDTNVDTSLTDDKGNDAVLEDFSKSGYVNGLCYFSDSVEFEFKYGQLNTLGCGTDGGPYKFCEIYRQQTVDSSASYYYTSYTPSKSTQSMLLQIDKNYGKLIEDAVEGSIVSKQLVIGLIATESNGNPNIVNEISGCAGLMQFCKGTAYDYNLCDNKVCSGTDYRLTPEKAIPAGVKLLEDNMKSFSSYTDRNAFALASYNGGAGLIKKAIAKTGKSDPSWEEVSAAITEDLIAEVYSNAFKESVYNNVFGTTEKRNNKVREVRNYVGKVMGYYYAYEQSSESKTIVVIGASNTEGSNSYVSKLQEKYSSATFYNKGHSGDSPMTQLARFDEDVLSYNPDIIIISPSGNGIGSSSFTSSVVTMAQKAKDSGAVVVVLSITPRKGYCYCSESSCNAGTCSAAWTEKIQTTVDEFNIDLLEYNLDSNDIDYAVNIYAPLEGEDDVCGYCTSDGGHLTQEGQKIVAQTIYDTVFG
ncbi:hypothetical protein COV16_03655 [Candidatus Woesearchaeota archaeon CG10_big_fil_rev_8_21_14_0_10_34_8]|nr:MAG: hypothetical protein COV16_03655 [Candidatus Woesearchaeota archaeon CG10_big_fil_rev_8_21_14_0_10_34_8]